VSVRPRMSKAERLARTFGRTFADVYEGHGTAEIGRLGSHPVWDKCEQWYREQLTETFQVMLDRKIIH
jgi:hypothetical protein